MKTLATEYQAEWCKKVYDDPAGHTDHEIALAFSILSGFPKEAIDKLADVVYNDSTSQRDSIKLAYVTIHKET